MAETADIPVLLFACVNTYRDTVRKKMLQQEQSRLTGLFHSPRSHTHPEVIDVRPEQGRFLPDQFRRYHLQPIAKVLHLSGYAAGNYLHIEGAWGEERFTPGQFAKQVARLPGLQVLFLNGCATPALIRELLLLDIPAIMAAGRAEVAREDLERSARAFYQQLASGTTLWEAYAAMQAQFPDRWKTQTLAYDLATDQLLEAGQPWQPEVLLPGLYLLHDNLSRLDWQLPQRPAPSLPPADQRARLIRRTRRIGSALVASLLLGVLVAILWQHPRVQQLVGEWERACTFAPEAQTYNVLQLPFYQNGTCDLGDKQIDAALSEGIRQLDARAYQHCPSDAAACTIDPVQAGLLMEASDASLVLWGSFDQLANRLVLRVHLLYTAEPGQPRQGQLMLALPYTGTTDVQPYLQQTGQELVHWAVGMGAYHRASYETAATAFEAIALGSETLYRLTRPYLARSLQQLEDYERALACYDEIISYNPADPVAYHERGTLRVRTRDYEGALRDFDHAVSLDPTRAETYYNRGLLYLRLDRYDEAGEDGERVLALRPEEGKAYGLLAATLAAQEEKEAFMVTMEKALQHGLEVESFISFVPVLNAYREDPDFQRLLDKY
ncbi:MAG: hypothetical protein OHK0039_47140 [Bacteroidia bacterium]